MSAPKGIETYYTREEVDAILAGEKTISPHERGRLARSIAWHEAVDDEAPWAMEVIKKSRARNLRRSLQSLGRLKRGQVYVIQWPRTDWRNGHPTTWLRRRGEEPAVRWQRFLKDNPVRLYCSTHCMPATLDRDGAGRGWRASIRWAYELAGVACAGCGGDLSETKGGLRNRMREQTKKLRKRKPTKPRGLVTLAQVRRQMAEADARIKKLR